MRTFALVVTLFGCLASVGWAGEGALIAVATEGKAAKPLVSPEAGRSGYFLLFDREGKLREFVANPHREAGESQALRLADFLATKKVNTLVAGRFDKAMTSALQAQKISPVAFNGKVSEALKQVLEKKPTRQASAPW